MKSIQIGDSTSIEFPSLSPLMYQDKPWAGLSWYHNRDGFRSGFRAPQELEQAEQKLNEAIEEQEAGPSGVLNLKGSVDVVDGCYMLLLKHGVHC